VHLWLQAGILIDCAVLIYAAAVSGWRLGVRYWSRRG
jgi:hypothetical protein